MGQRLDRLGMGSLLVLNKDEDSISIVNPDSGSIERTVETDFNPHEVTVDSAGEEAYVTCSLGGSLLVYDTTTWERLTTITHEAFDFPHGVAIRSSAEELWLAATGSSTLFVIDTDSHDIREMIETGEEQSHMVSITPDESRAYVANIGSDTVTVIDCEDRAIVGHVAVGEGPEGIAAMAEYVLVANQDDSLLSVVDHDELAQVNRALLGTTPVRVVPQPAGRYVFVANRESNDISVIDTEHVRDDEVRPWEVRRVPVGIWPGGTVFDETGATAYVANNKTNDVSVIDVDEFAERRRIDVGLHPDGIAYLAQSP